MANLKVTHNVGKAKEQNTQNYPNSGPPGNERTEAAQLPVTGKQKNKHGVPARLPGGPAAGFRGDQEPEGRNSQREPRGGNGGREAGRAGFEAAAERASLSLGGGC